MGEAKLYWKTPPLGKYMNYKEILSYAVGGIGWYLIVTVVQSVMLSVGNFIIGNAIGIRPTHLYILYVIAMIMSFPATALRANIIDNTRNRKGKYRPYLISMGIPTCILGIGFVWMPYERMPYVVNCIVVLLFNIGFQFIYMFFYDAYENLIYVLSPNTQERTNASAVKAVVYSFAPSVVNLIMPIASKWISNGNLASMRLYRIMYPPMLIVGMLICIIAYANTQEKIIQAKTHHVHMKFIDTLRAVARNKYFWIISVASWLGFLESSYNNILAWTYNYRRPCSEATYGLIVTLYGNASLWGMLCAPAAIKRYGKKKVLVVINILNIAFIAMMYPVIVGNPSGMIWLLLCCLWLNALVGSFAHVLNPSIQGDIRDYQQYISGERIDGMFSAVGLIGTVITTLTSGILPAAYERGGINEDHFYAVRGSIEQIASQYNVSVFAENGEPDLYAVLYDPETFNNIIVLLILLSVIGAIMNVVPYFFYDLTEVKQRGIVKILKVRAMFEDFGNNALSDKELVEGIDLIRENRELSMRQPIDLNASKANVENCRKANKAAVESLKRQLKESSLSPEEKKEKLRALREKNSDDLRAAKKQYKNDQETNIEIETAVMLMDELSKFSTDVFKEKVEIAKRVYAGGLEGLRTFDMEELNRAKAMPAGTKEEKRYRREAITSANDRRRSVKLIAKYYPDQITEFDFSVFETLFESEDKINEELAALYKQKHELKVQKKKDELKALEMEIQKLKTELGAVRGKIKDATDASSVYSRCAKPYNDSKKLLNQEENYKHYEDIVAMYDEAKVRAAEKEAQDMAERERIEAEEKAYAEKLRAEKAAKKLEKKSKK